MTENGTKEHITYNPCLPVAVGVVEGGTAAIGTASWDFSELSSSQRPLTVTSGHHTLESTACVLQQEVGEHRATSMHCNSIQLRKSNHFTFVFCSILHIRLLPLNQ